MLDITCVENCPYMHTKPSKEDMERCFEYIAKRIDQEGNINNSKILNLTSEYVRRQQLIWKNFDPQFCNEMKQAITKY